MNSLFYNTLFFSVFAYVLSIDSIQLRNTKYQFIIFNRKVIPKTLNRIKTIWINHYNMYIEAINKPLIEYNALPEDEKTLIEFIISMVL